MVQGVGYRYFVRRTAERLGVTGTVKNLGDGSVEVYAVGTEAQLSSMRAELERGPRAASVSAVSEEEAPIELRYAERFEIEHDW